MDAQSFNAKPSNDFKRSFNLPRKLTVAPMSIKNSNTDNSVFTNSGIFSHSHYENLRSNSKTQLNESEEITPFQPVRTRKKIRTNISDNEASRAQTELIPKKRIEAAGWPINSQRFTYFSAVLLLPPILLSRFYSMRELP